MAAQSTIRFNIIFKWDDSEAMANLKNLLDNYEPTKFDISVGLSSKPEKTPCDEFLDFQASVELEGSRKYLAALQRLFPNGPAFRQLGNFIKAMHKTNLSLEFDTLKDFWKAIFTEEYVNPFVFSFFVHFLQNTLFPN